VNPSGAEGVLDVRLTEIALFVGGGIVTLMVLALAIWLFVRASREEREQEERERRDRERRRTCAEGRDEASRAVEHRGEEHRGEEHRGDAQDACDPKSRDGGVA
jgi:ABC-type nickel/cobalt efflux system permease component RcnA